MTGKTPEVLALQPVATVVTLAEQAQLIAGLAERRWDLLAEDDDPGARDRARQLREHVRTYVLPRVAAVELPLIVVLLGPTGAGKSTLMNTLARAPVSRTGVLRPTTREAVLLATDPDAQALLRSALAGMPEGRLVRAPAAAARAGLALVDAPDLDSIERANRVVADALVEAADLGIFVTTATRYADKVPFDVLQRIAERGLPLLIVVNRLPTDDAEREVVLADFRKVLAGTPLRGLDDSRIEIIGIDEGQLGSSGESFTPDAAARVLARVDELAADRERRVALAKRALAGALAGLDPLIASVAADVEREAAEAEAVRAIARNAYDAELAALVEEMRGGTFLRTEVLRHWESYVKADQITRFFSRGLGRLRGTIVTAIRGMPEAPVGVMEREVSSDVVAATVSRATEAARRVASEWSSHPRAAARLGRAGLGPLSASRATLRSGRRHPIWPRASSPVSGSGSRASRRRCRPVGRPNATSRSASRWASTPSRSPPWSECSRTPRASPEPSSVSSRPPGSSTKSSCKPSLAKPRCAR